MEGTWIWNETHNKKLLGWEGLDSYIRDVESGEVEKCKQGKLQDDFQPLTKKKVKNSI